VRLSGLIRELVNS